MPLPQEFERLRESERAEAMSVAQAAEVEQEKRDAVLAKLIASREEEATAKAQAFANKQEMRGQKIRKDNQHRADAAWQQKLQVKGERHRCSLRFH